MLMRTHHFHYGMARSIIVVLLLVGGVYVLTLYVPSVKLFIADRMGVSPAVLGVTTQKTNPQKQFQTDMINNFNAIKKQPISLDQIINTVSRTKLMVNDGKDILEYLQAQAKTIKIPHAPKL
jgi:hypothetical protein